MSDYFDRLELELRTAVPRVATHAAPARRLRAFRGGLGNLAAAFSVVVALGVAALAIVLLGHGRRAALRPSTIAIAPAALKANGVGAARFGQSRHDVASLVSSSLRERPGAYRRGGTCGLDHTLTWPRHARRGTLTLTLFFIRGRFAGYAYGPYDALAARGKQRGIGLSTGRGLHLGDTTARGRRLYGKAFHISAAQGGSWSVGGSGGLVGYLSAPPIAHGRIASIDAGDVGCPAVSP